MTCLDQFDETALLAMVMGQWHKRERDDKRETRNAGVVDSKASMR